mmetsp:Transcript_37302/g.57262  ORF Transcript_37302/g.57262 Transcript_37302/m.57262 type:complete len:112 (-) Transcript_37302:77-412(-)
MRHDESVVAEFGYSFPCFYIFQAGGCMMEFVRPPKCSECTTKKCLSLGAKQKNNDKSSDNTLFAKPCPPLVKLIHPSAILFLSSIVVISLRWGKYKPIDPGNNTVIEELDR